MKRVLITTTIVLLTFSAYSQSIKSNNAMLDKAFELAVNTVDKNTEHNLLRAGGGYTSEWTRDISINCWNGTSLFRPQVSEHSLWSVTQNKRQTVGHQHWDKIIWVTAALNHYLVTGDSEFLSQAYLTSKNTMAELEGHAFDAEYGLFTGPAVFQDGIAGYDEPIADLTKYSSYILDYDAAKYIKCLSTNCIYYSAYQALEKMSLMVGDGLESQYAQKGRVLKSNIRKHLYNAKAQKLNYLIDQNGKVHDYNEGLGIAFAGLTGVLTKKEMSKIVDNLYISERGLPCVWPIYPRFSVEKPGRHNNMIWPFVNAFFAESALKAGDAEKFYFELENLAFLAIEKGPDNFQEIYNITTGEPDGGWQVGGHWGLKADQTWSATGYIRMFLLGVFGLSFQEGGVEFKPYGMKDGRSITLSGVKYRNSTLNITLSGRGSKVKKFTLNGVPTAPYLPANVVGEQNISIELK